MMPCKFTAIDGSVRELDLDAVFDVVLGYSGRRAKWTATIVYDQNRKAFIELRSAPPDYRGNSAEEAEEISDQYLLEVFQLNKEQLQSLRNAPGKWRLIDKR